MPLSRSTPCSSSPLQLATWWPSTRCWPQAATKMPDPTTTTTCPLASSLWSCLIWLGAGLIGSGSSERKAAPLEAGEIYGSSAEPHGRGTLSRTRASTNRAMTTVSATEARKRLYTLIDEVGESHEPVQITGKRSNAVLLSEDDWRAIQETLHLVLIPGMRESILEGMATEVSELSSEPLW